MYLKELGKEADVKSDTVVLKFTPDKNKERKENYIFLSFFLYRN